jgi:hypothetical protein
MKIACAIPILSGAAAAALALMTAAPALAGPVRPGRPGAAAGHHTVRSILRTGSVVTAAQAGRGVPRRAGRRHRAAGLADHAHVHRARADLTGGRPRARGKVGAMSVRGGSPEPALAAQLRLGQGFHEADRAQVLTELSSLGRHLAHWSPDRVDLEVSVKDRGGPQQMVTLEAWLPGWPSQVAHSAAADLRRALVEVRQEMIRRIEDGKARRQPH